MGHADWNPLRRVYLGKGDLQKLGKMEPDGQYPGLDQRPLRCSHSQAERKREGAVTETLRNSHSCRSVGSAQHSPLQTT